MCSMSMCFETPDYSHVATYEDVYEPSEDTFLMLDALEEEADLLKARRYNHTIGKRMVIYFSIDYILCN